MTYDVMYLFVQKVENPLFNVGIHIDMLTKSTP